MLKKNFTKHHRLLGGLAGFVLGIFLVMPLVSNAILVTAPPRIIGTGAVTSTEILDDTILSVDVDNTATFEFAKIGIGTSTPYAKLTIWSSTTTIETLLAIVNHASTTLLHLSSGGHLGVGTTSPAAKLGVHGNAYISGDLEVGGITATGTLAFPTDSITSTFIKDGDIVNADINASAAIVDTKLAQITTASKVHGSAITGLASLPAGAGIIPATNLSGMFEVVATSTAAENVSAGKPIAIATSTQDLPATENSNGNASSRYGGIAFNDQVAQDFDPPFDTTITKFVVVLKKTGSPTDSTRIGLQTDSGGDPSGTWIRYVDVAGTGLATTFATTTLTATSSLTITNGTTYHLVYDRTGAAHDSNYYWHKYKTSDVYAYGQYQLFNGSSWSDRTEDSWFRVLLSLVGNQVYEASGKHYWFADAFVGITNEACTSGNECEYTVYGSNNEVSGLTGGRYYYLSDTSGAFSTTPGTYSRRIGKALDDSRMLVLQP